MDDSDLISTQCEQDQVDIVLKLAVDLYNGTNSLIISDNCSSHQDVKNRTIELS